MAKKSRAKSVAGRGKKSSPKKLTAAAAPGGQARCEQASDTREPHYVAVESWVINYLKRSYPGGVTPDMTVDKDLALKAQDIALLGQAFAQDISKPPFNQFVDPANFHLNPGQLQNATSGKGKNVGDIVCRLYLAVESAPKRAPQPTPVPATG